jgi:hypothetical protein
MTTRTGKKRIAMVMGIAMTAIVVLLWGEAFAKLPEPDNIVYGLAGDGAVTVSLSVDGQPIASYRMGENPNAGDFYVLRIPMDSLDPAEPGTARPGDTATVLVNDEAVALIKLGERGSVYRLDLDIVDLDGDRLPDDWEQQIVDADPNDGITGIGDVFPLEDFDGDGFCNMREFLAGSSPVDGMVIPDITVVYVDDSNTSGLEDGTEAHPFNTIQEGVNLAGPGDTVRVLGGYYPENVVVVKGILLIGDGAGVTLIDGSGHELPGVSCSGFQGGQVEGFRIVNGVSAGIMCSNAALSIWGNDIASTRAGDGIRIGTGSSVDVLNNTICLNEQSGVRYEGSYALVLNNTIVGNGGDGVTCLSGAGVEITNNIVASNEGFGVLCAGAPNPWLFYNNVWDNGGGSYGACAAGKGDMEKDPKFLDAPNADYRLSPGSPCIDAGDPIEILTADYTGGVLLRVEAVTNIAPGDMIWVTDGVNTESAEVIAVTDTTIGIEVALVSSYLVSKGSYVFTESSDFSVEPEPNGARINMGFYGGTEGAEVSVYPAPDELVVDMGASGLWHHDGTEAELVSLHTGNPQGMLSIGSNLYVDFGGVSTGGIGFWKYDGVWTRLSPSDAKIMAPMGVGSQVYVDFGSLGLYRYTGSGWIKLSAGNCEKMLGIGSVLYADFGGVKSGGTGFWKYDGIWTQLSKVDAQDMTAIGTDVYVDFGASGLWRYAGGWVRLSSSDPQSMLVTGNRLYGDFGSVGLWKYDGTWERLSPSDPQDVVAEGSDLYVDFGAVGLWKYDGDWTKLSESNAEGMCTVGGMLYADLGSTGLWKYDGDTWVKVSPSNPVAMVAAGTNLYVDFGAIGFWKYDGSVWKKLGTGNVEAMCPVNLE